MKKIGICACYDTRNYGSMLQSLATQIKIDQLGYESEFIIYKKKKTIGFIMKQIPRLFNQNLLHDKLMKLQKKITMSFYPDIVKMEQEREKAFVGFKNRFYRTFSPVYYGYDELKKHASDYDTVIVGSDQLWTPGGLASNFYNLMFVPDNINKVSYATSFGVSRIPKYQKKRTREYLKRIDHLSVREIRGAQIVNEISGREAKIVADPTLLLTNTEWEEIIPSKSIVDEKYIFCYFLGSNKNHRVLANELKRKTGYQLVTTPFLDSFVKEDITFGDKKLFNIGPDGFVNLIRNAEYVITDSFHGSIFSILHHKPFLVLNRFGDGVQSRNSRIDSLLEITNLAKRRGNNSVEPIFQDIEWQDVDEKVNELRKDSIDYLIKALN